MSKTKEALRLLDENPGLSKSAAARAVGISTTAVFTGLRIRRQTARMRCPTCDHILPFLKNVFREE